MKRKFYVGLLVMALILLLVGCSCEHEWLAATCAAPKTCKICGETEGEMLSHIWQDITCAAPKTCQLCGETEGEALPHTWQEATCSAPKTCTVCSATEGEALPHTLGDMTVTKEPNCTEVGEGCGDCTVCGAKQVTAEIPTNDVHVFTKTVVREATCTDKGEGINKCKLCQYSEPSQLEKKAHAYGKEEIVKEPTCTQKGKKELVCKDCGYLENETIAAVGHKWEGATCTKAGTCSVCGAKGKKADHNYTVITDTEYSKHGVGELTKKCEDCGKKVTEYRTAKYTINLNTICSELAAYAKSKGFKTSIHEIKGYNHYKHSIAAYLLDLHAKGGNKKIIADAKSSVDQAYNEYARTQAGIGAYTLHIYAYHTHAGEGLDYFNVVFDVTS